MFLDSAHNYMAAPNVEETSSTAISLVTHAQTTAASSEEVAASTEEIHA